MARLPRSGSQTGTMARRCGKSQPSATILLFLKRQLTPCRPPREEAMNSGPRLAVGALGRDVQRAQTIFVMMKTLGFDQIDGVFGAVTRNAVMAFQQGEGLVADGVIGDDTWKRMPADPDTPLLRRGGVGNAVSGLQKGLLKFGRAGAPTQPRLAARAFWPPPRTPGKA